MSKAWAAIDTTAASLEMAASIYRYDPDLDRIADMPAAERAKLPAKVIDHAQIYADLRAAYREAVAAGAIADDRGPHTHKASVWG